MRAYELRKFNEDNEKRLRELASAESITLLHLDFLNGQLQDAQEAFVDLPPNVRAEAITAIQKMEKEILKTKQQLGWIDEARETLKKESAWQRPEPDVTEQKHVSFPERGKEKVSTEENLDDYFRAYPTSETKPGFVDHIFEAYIAKEISQADVDRTRKILEQDWQKFFLSVQEETKNNNPLPTASEMYAGSRLNYEAIHEALDRLLGEDMGMRISGRLSYFVHMFEELAEVQKQIDNYEAQLARNRTRQIAKTWFVDEDQAKSA